MPDTLTATPEGVVTLVPLKEIHPAEWNPRDIAPDDLDDLVESMRTHPRLLWDRPVLIQKRSGDLYAGNMRYRGAVRLAASGQWPAQYRVGGLPAIPARVNDVSDEEAYAYALIDNNQAGTFQPQETATLIEQLKGKGWDLRTLGFKKPDLDALIAAIQKPPTEEGGDEEEVSFTAHRREGPTRTKVGEVWKLGPHRLLVGDALDPDQVKRLMGTDRAHLFMVDPPYGIEYDAIVDARANQRQGGWEAIEGDADNPQAVKKSLLSLFLAARNGAVSTHAAWFVWSPPLANAAIFLAALDEVGVRVHKQIIWSKPHFVFGRWEYHWQHEICWYGWQEGGHPSFYGDRSESTVWEVKHDGERMMRSHAAQADESADGVGLHPTQKPVALWERALRNHTKVGQVVYDPMAGSGPALIAAERLGRVARIMDIDPYYCDDMLARWEKESGGEATRIDR